MFWIDSMMCVFSSETWTWVSSVLVIMVTSSSPPSMISTLWSTIMAAWSEDTTRPTLVFPVTRTASAATLVRASSSRSITSHQLWCETSHCLSLFISGWRLFDDSTVTTVEESQVVTRYAYVLFYRRRNAPVERPSHLLGPLGAESSAATSGAASQVSSAPSHLTAAQWKNNLISVEQLYTCSLKLQGIG